MEINIYCVLIIRKMKQKDKIHGLIDAFWVFMILFVNMMLQKMTCDFDRNRLRHRRDSVSLNAAMYAFHELNQEDIVYLRRTCISTPTLIPSQSTDSSDLEVDDALDLLLPGRCDCTGSRSPP